MGCGYGGILNVVMSLLLPGKSLAFSHLLLQLAWNPTWNTYVGLCRSSSTVDRNGTVWFILLRKLLFAEK